LAADVLVDRAVLEPIFASSLEVTHIGQTIALWTAKENLM